MTGTATFETADPTLIGLQLLLEFADRDLIVVLRGESGSENAARATAAATRWSASGGAVERVDPAAEPARRTGAPTLVIADQARIAGLARGLREQDRLLVLADEPIATSVDGFRLVELGAPSVADEDADWPFGEEELLAA